MTDDTARKRMLSLLTDAARELLPVIVDLGRGQPKLDGYASGVERDGQGARLHLAPIAVGALAKADAWVCIRPAVLPRSWELHAQGIVAHGGRGAVVDLARARLVEGGAVEATPLVRSDLLVLVIPGGLDDRNAYVFPIIGVTADVCEIQATDPLEPGARWNLVEIIGDRKLLRRASAQVLDAEPWYLADGNPCFRCRLALGPEVVEAERSYDLVTQAAQVRRLLDFAGMTNAPGYYEAPGWGRGALRFIEVDKDSATLELHPAPRVVGLPQRHVRIGVELFAVQYEMEVRVLTVGAGRVHTSLPLILRRRRRHRRAHRIPVPPTEALRLVFLHPVTGSCETHPVCDVSFYGISFRTDPLGSVLWRGLPLERAHLDWRGCTIALGDLAVEELEGPDANVVCRASISDARVVDDTDMIALLATLAHPDVRVYDGEGFDAMLAMYLDAGLFAPHMHRNLSPILDQTKDVWRRLHRGASEVVRTLVHGPVGAPDAAVTVMRAWEHGWVAQHFVDVNPAINGATGKLQTAYLDHLIPRADGRFLVFFIKEDNHVMNGYMRRFFASVGTPESVGRSLVELWSHTGTTGSHGVSHPGHVRAMTAEDAIIVARAAERALGIAGATALSMRFAEMELPDSRARFARAGLDRQRECEILWCDETRALALLDERATPGLNLTWMLNATWILPIAADADSRALKSALSHVLTRPPQSATGERFLNLPAGFDPTPLLEAGFQKEATVCLYALNRTGVHRFHEYATLRYGELGARAGAAVARRERKRAAAE